MKSSKNRAVFFLLLVIVWGFTGVLQADDPGRRLILADDPLVIRSGDWSLQHSATGVTYLRSTASQDNVLTLPFTGNYVEVRYIQGPDLGTLAVEVDGRVLRTFSTTQANVTDGRTFIDYLDNSQHVVRVYPVQGHVAVTGFVTTSLEVALSRYQRVIVGLDVPFAPEASLPNHTSVQHQRDAINQARQDVLVALEPYRHIILAQSTNWHIPYVALSVDEATLEFLQQLPSVTGIYEDRALIPQLAESTAIINVGSAWEDGYDGTGTSVAILDTGVNTAHAFLGGRVLEEACYSSPASGATTLCPGGISPQTGTGAASPAGCAGIAGCDHGTHVAGIVAGNGDTFDGVARGANLMAIQTYVKIDDSLTCLLNGQPEAPCILTYTSDQISALQYVFQNYDNHNVVAVNLSAGSGTFTSACDTENTAFNAAVDQLVALGIPVIAPSGDGYQSDSLAFPACISNVISVGATTDADAVADFSNSASLLDLLAPGVDITSSLISDFGSMDGTSQAVAHVSGAWAILKQVVPQAELDVVLSALQSTGTPITDSRNNVTTSRIDVGNAATLLAEPDTLALVNPDLNYVALVETLDDWPTWPDEYNVFVAGTGILGQWVMGDWDGDGIVTLGVYADGANAGAFFFTNQTGTTPPDEWISRWIGFVGVPVAGRMDSDFDNDCIGIVETQGTVPNDTYALHFTCDLDGPIAPTIYGQWMGRPLADLDGFSGERQYVMGDWDEDDLESIAVRRSEYIAYTNVSPGESADDYLVFAVFDKAQYIGAPGNPWYGQLVAGDWDADGVDSFGLFYNDGFGSFFRRNDLEWNSGVYITQHVGQPVGDNLWAMSWRRLPK